MLYPAEMISSLYLNTYVNDLDRTKKFFTELGFSFDPRFSNEGGLCMIVADNIRAMFTKVEKFMSMLDKPVADPQHTEVFISLQCDTKEDVDRIATTAFANGGRKINEAEENEFMYSWGFEDLDGHVWDLFWFNTENKG
jgi:predicted lactoylglutathione lyase